MRANDPRGDGIFEAMRRALVEVLVPEIRQLRQEMSERFEALHREMNERFAALQREMGERFEALHREMNERFLDVYKEIAGIKEEMKDIRGDIKVILLRLDTMERTTRLEAQVQFILSTLKIQLPEELRAGSSR